MKKAIILMILLTAVITVTLTLLLTRSSGTNTSHGEVSHDKESLSLEISGLKLEPAIAGESLDMVTATGKVSPDADRVVKVSSRIPGKVVKIYAKVGDVVRQGQILALVSSNDLAQARAAYRQAAAKVKAAKEACNRQVELAKLGLFTKRPVEEARSEFTATRGDLAQAESELSQSRSELARAESELAQCRARLERARELYKDEIISRQDLESAEAEYKRDSADVDTVKAKIRQVEAKIEQAQAQAVIAKGYLEREQRILDRGLLNRREIQAARAELTAAELELRAVADTIRIFGATTDGSGDTIAITSPISGRVVERIVTLGEMVEPSTVLFTVMNLSDIWIEADIYEKDLAKVREGQRAEIRVNSYPDKLFTGKVSFISDTLDQQSRTARIRCIVRNPGGLLKPEMFASIKVAVAKRGDAVLIPREAVLDESGKKIVFIACMDCEEDEKAGRSICGSYDKREVVVGPEHDGKLEVRGVEVGEQVVTTGAYQLKTALGSGKLEAGCTDH